MKPSLLALNASFESDKGLRGVILVSTGLANPSNPSRSYIFLHLVRALFSSLWYWLNFGKIEFDFNFKNENKS